jgi:hypothetical protein
MPTITLVELKTALNGLQRQTGLFDAINMMREAGLISEVEEAQLKVRHRAKLKAAQVEIIASDAE